MGSPLALVSSAYLLPVFLSMNTTKSLRLVASCRGTHRIPRFGLSVAIAPAFDRIIAFLMEKTGRGKTVATVLCVVLVNILGTFAVLFSGIFLASLFSGEGTKYRRLGVRPIAMLDLPSR